MKIYMIEGVLKIRNTIILFFTLRRKGRGLQYFFWTLKTLITVIERFGFNKKLNQET